MTDRWFGRRLDDGSATTHGSEAASGWYASRVSDDEGDPSTQEPVTVSGTELRMFWDDDVLWDRYGALPARDRTWLSGSLGLSDELIDQFLEWAAGMDELEGGGWHQTPRAAHQAWDARRDELRTQGRAFAHRLAAELDGRFTVVYEPA